MTPQWDPTYSLVGGIAAAFGITLSADITHLSVAVVAAMIGASAWLVSQEVEMGRVKAISTWLIRVAVAVIVGGLIVQIGIKAFSVDLRLIVAPVFGWLAFKGPRETFDLLASYFNKRADGGSP